MAKKINIVYTDRGWLGIENQTRYDTADLLAIANWIEARLEPDQEPKRPLGSVIQFVDWKHECPFVSERRWEGEKYIIDSRPNWVQMNPPHAWNVVKVVPPDRLFSNLIEALAWDGTEAPLQLVHYIIRRLSHEFGHWKFSGPGKLPEMRLRINKAPGSRRRGADHRVERMSIGLNKLSNSRRHTGRSRYRLMTAKGRLCDAADDIALVDPSLRDKADSLIEALRNIEEELERVNQAMRELSDIAAVNNYTKPRED